jgi:hypothetical protein
MITQFFGATTLPKTVDTEYFSVYKNALSEHLPNITRTSIFRELEQYLHTNKNNSRVSCLECESKISQYITYYKFEKLQWTSQIKQIRDHIKRTYNECIDYSIVHYYLNDTASIAWHSDKEAKFSPIYIVNIGGTRRFCLRPKTNIKDVRTFDLNHGDILCMKPGCQIHYEHCIKSVRRFCEPRFSITLRRIDIPSVDFTFNGLTAQITPSIKTFKPCVSNEYAHDMRLIKTDENQRKNDCTKFSINHSYTLPIFNKSLLKSNLQKAIRRGEIDCAINTAIYMVCTKMEIELLRRLTVIAFEDVGFHANGFCVLMWLYMAVSAKNAYILTIHDIRWISTWIKTVCQILHPPINLDIALVALQKTTQNIVNSTVTRLLNIRILFGGFTGEIRIIEILINSFSTIHIDHELPMFNSDNLINLTKYGNSPHIIPESIDFHCFPNMSFKISDYINNPDINSDYIRKYIWVFDSNINIRVPNPSTDLDKTIWNNIIQPQCVKYRSFILTRILT